MNTIKLILVGLISLYLFIGAIIYFLQEQFIFLPDKLPEDFKFEFDHDFEEHFLSTKNGGKINVLHFKTQDAKGLIVYFHGNAGSLERWGDVISPFVDMGYDVLIPDYRG